MGEDIKSEIKLELDAIVHETKATEASKINFIKEIKNGLGEEIKKTRGVRVIKRPWYIRFFKKLLTNF